MKSVRLVLIVEIRRLNAAKEYDWLVCDEIDGMINEHLLSLTLRRESTCIASGLAAC